jgi:FixJ family two-component response regulator
MPDPVNFAAGPVSISAESIVYVVDDEPPVRDALRSLLHSVGIAVADFPTIDAFFCCDMPPVPSCVILDVRLKGQSGLAAQARIAQDFGIPIIFITGYADVEMSVQAMKAGACDFIEKPFRGQRMLDAVSRALNADRCRRDLIRSSEKLLRCFGSLTPRERDVMGLVAKGLLNKQIATRLKLSEITVKMHRGKAMKKMEARSIADFVLKADALGLADWRG